MAARAEMACALADAEGQDGLRPTGAKISCASAQQIRDQPAEAGRPCCLDSCAPRCGGDWLAAIAEAEGEACTDASDSDTLDAVPKDIGAALRRGIARHSGPSIGSGDRHGLRIGSGCNPVPLASLSDCVAFGLRRRGGTALRRQADTRPTGR